LRTLAAAAVVAASLLVAAPARAATPLVVGTGADPGLAVDAAGTAYLAWNGTEPGGTRSLHFCRLPRGAKTCADTPVPVPDGTYSLSQPFVVVGSGGTVQITQSRYGFAGANFTQVLQFTSPDGGSTWGPGVQVGTITVYAAVNGPGGVSGVTNATTAGAFFQTMGAGNTASALLSADHLYNGAVGVTPDGRLVAIFDDGSGNAQFRLNNGGDANDPATWGPPVDLGVESYPRLAGGPSGLVLLGENANGDLEARKWNGTTFGAPVVLGSGREAAQADLSQDAGGRFHAVWPTFEADGIALHYAVSDDGIDGQQGVLVTQTDGEPAELRVAAAPDHVGVAVWTTASQVRVLPVGPAPPPEFHQSVAVRRVSGKVLVKLPGSKRFVPLSAAGLVPLGASVDVRHGRIALSSAPSKTGKVQTVQLYSGQFKVTQPGHVTQFALNGPLARCPRGKAAAAAAKKKPKTRRLWGDGKGSFRTKGRYSAATVRGTRWLVQDSCAGTLTRVVRGVVAVRDNVRHKTVVVRAGKRYLARARR
jgi:hypothetical protein